MSVLLKQAKIIDPNSSFNGQRMDILIEKGVITKIAKTIKSAKSIIEYKNLHVSPGWFDTHSNFRDPGEEHKEDLSSGIKAAINGGYTGVTCMPGTYPAVDNKSAVEYVKSKTAKAPIAVYPTGTLTEQLKGENISEMFDMYKAGAVGFTDDKKSVNNADLLKRALQYTQAFDALCMNFPNDKQISHEAKVNEGANSTKLGLKGTPTLAEDLMVNRDLFVLEYAGGKLHLQTISSGNAVDLIRKAKKKNLDVTCEVAAINLLLSDDELNKFDSNYKVFPPLRTSKEIKQLIKGLKDGTIDIICSDHTPEDLESKHKEFEHALCGISSLETTFATANMAFNEHKLPLELLIEKIAINPKNRFGQNNSTIEKGAVADLTLFDPKKKWIVEASKMASKSKNNPFLGKELTGKALAVYCKGKLTTIA